VTTNNPANKRARSRRIGVAESWLVGSVSLGAVSASVAVSPGWTGVSGAALAVLMLTIAAIDRRQQIIPDPLNGLAFAGGLVAAGLHAEISPTGAALNALVRAVVMLSLFFVFRAGFRKMRGFEGMGLGDVKLAAVAGIWLDWSLLPIAVELAAIGALAVVMVGRLRGDRFDARTRLPFGAYFGPAIWICWLLGVWRGD
jgi:leader peptidase (prepilin peptidase)/N-methyltransferase